MAEKTRPSRGQTQSLGIPYPSKVEVPARRAAIIHRQRLIEALSDVVNRRVAVVSAPPGYGKTTLLVDFAGSRSEPVCWYSLDERDTDAATFLRYFVAAGRKHFPDFGAELLNALEKEGDELSASRMTDLLVAATASADGQLIFVLDDFHFLDRTPGPLREAIEGWVYRIPPGAHVILSGRTRPQISVLPMMAVRQEVATITAGDFSFTCDEVAQLFREVLATDISLDDAQRLADLTEGWAGALVLLADRVQSSGAVTLEQLRGSDTLFQYIALEQFQPLPDDLREFLRCSAVLRSLDIPTINDLLGANDAEEKLNTLTLLNLVVPPDDASQPHRYHRLFRAFLVSHLRANDADRFRDLNIKAAELMEGAERWDDAVYHYIQAAAWDSIIQITDRVGSRMFEEGQWDTLAEWMDAVPAEQLAAYPRLVLWKARVLYYLNQIDRSLALISQAEQQFQSGKEPLADADALMTKGMCLRVKGDYEESRDALVRARDLLVENDGPAPVIIECRKELGITLSFTGQINQSIEELSVVVDVYEAQGDAYNIAHASDQLAASLGLAGKLAETAGYLERARQLWTQLGNDHRLVQTLINLGMSYYTRSDFDQAETIFEQGLEKARKVGNLKWELYLSASLGDVKRDTGHYTRALEIYRAALDDAWTVGDAYISVYLQDAIANTYRLQGDIPNAESWSAQALAEAEKTGGALELGISLMTAALIKRQQEELKGAIDLLQKAVPYLKEKGAQRELAVAYFHLAGAYFSLKRKTLALEMLEACATIAQGLGYDHFLIVEAARNPLLVQYASANKVAEGYYTRLLKLMKGAAPTGAGGEATEDGAAPDESNVRTIYAYGFGNLRVESGGREITDLEWRSEKSKEMFFFFLANRRPLRKEEIVTALWPEMAEEKTTSAFHSNMYRLRKALYQDVIAKDSGRYILDPQARFVFDIEDYQTALQQADAAPKGSAKAIAAMERALELYKGAFAADFYSEWAQNLRYQFEEQQMSLLGGLAAAYNEAGEYKKSADVCQRIIEVDEFNEAAWYRLMSNYIQSGQSEAARYCYNRYVQIISQDDIADEIPEFDDIVGELTGKRRP